MNSKFVKISSRENISNSLFAKFSSRENKVLYSIHNKVTVTRIVMNELAYALHRLLLTYLSAWIAATVFHL